MPPTYAKAPLSTFDPMNVGLIPEDVRAVAENWFVNRHPLTNRFRHGPVNSESWKIANEKQRPRSVKLTVDVNNSATSITVDDASVIEPDDVIEIESERLLVSATSGAAPGTLTVARGYSGTAAASHTAGAGLDTRLITNTRTGYAENLDPMIAGHAAFTNYIMTVQSSYAVGGRAQRLDNYMGGSQEPLDREKMACLRRVLDNFEVGLYLGQKVANAGPTSRTQTAGLKQQIVTNKTTSPTNASAYSPTDMVRDLVQTIFNAGGEPTHLLCSSDWLSGFYKWGLPNQRTDPRETALGVKIRTLTLPWLDDVQTIVAPLLPSGTLVMLSEPEVVVRTTTELIDIPRARDGDAVRGDMLIEGGLELANESHHAWVSGVTGFAAA